MLPRQSRSVFSCLVLPQNGVPDQRIHYGPGVSSPQIDMDTSIDSQNGNVASSDSPKRPNKLEVTQLNGYAAKSFSPDVEDGSLPCSPEPDSETDVSEGHAGNEVLENDTRELISSLYRDFTGLSKSRWGETKELSTMKRVMDDVLTKHRLAYNGMVTKLALDNKTDMTFVSEVAESLFSDRITNWGRIVSLVAFGAVVSKYLKERGRKECVELVSQEISTYLLSHQRDWLLKNNSWQGFMDFFRVADPESTVRNTLMAIAGFAGMGATLAFLIR